MANETNKVTLEAGVSVEKLIDQMNKLREESTRSIEEMTKAAQSSKSANEELSRQLAQTLGRIEAQRKEIERLNAELVKVAANNKAAFDPAQQKAYEDQIKKLEDELAGLKKEGTEAVDSVNKKTKEGATLFGQMKAQAVQMLGALAKASLIGFGIAAVTEIFKGLRDAIFSVSRARQIQINIEKDAIEISKQSQQAAAKERIELEALLSVARDETKSKLEREAAIKRINDRMPDYIGNLTLETINTEKTNEAIKAYINEIEAKARAQAYISIIQSKYNKLIEQELLLIQVASIKNGTIRNEIVRQINNSIEDINKEIKLTQDKFNSELRLGKASLDLEKERKKTTKEMLQDTVDLTKKTLKDAKAAMDQYVKDQKEKERLNNKSNRDAEKAERERLRAQELQEQKLQRIANLEKELAEVRTSLMAEGRAKQIKEENVQYTAQIEALDLLRKKNETSAEEIKLIDQIKEERRKQHLKNLLEIDKNFYAEVHKAFQEAQDNIDAVLLKDQDKEIAALNLKYRKVIESVEAARVKANQGTNSPFLKAFYDGEAANLVLDLTEALNKETAAITEKYNLKKIDDAEKLALALNDIIKVEGLNEVKLTELKERNKLQITINFAKERLKILEKDKEANKLAIAELTKAIQDAQKALDKPTEDNEDLFSFLGIDEDGEKKIMQIAQAVSILGDQFSNFFDALVSGIDRRIEKQQELIDKIDEGISKQQEAVDREKALAEEGFANNLQVEEAKLIELEKQREKELEIEKKIRKEKADLQKLQIAADAVAQSSSLITASASIFKAMAPLGPIGVGLAVTAIAVMLAAFAAAKITAFKQVNDEAKIMRKGGYFDLLDGEASHERGGVDVVRKDGTRIAEFEGDEKLFVVNKGSSKKYESLLDAINKDQLSGWSVDRLRGLVKPTGMQFNRSGETQSTTVIDMTGDQVAGDPDNEYLRRIAESNEKMLDLEKNREEVREFHDRTEYKKGNTTRIIYKNGNNARS